MKSILIERDDCKSEEGFAISETINVKTSLKQWMNPFIQYIRFTLMKNDFFVQNVCPLNVLEMEHSWNIALSIMDPTREINVKYIKNVSQRNKVIYYHKVCNYQKTKVLQYSLEMSSSYKGSNNSYQALTNNVVTEGCSTNNTKSEFIVASFDKKKYITRMDIGAYGNVENDQKVQWNSSHLNNRKVQWKNDSNIWIDWKVLKDFKDDDNIKTIHDVNIHTNAIRIFDDTEQHISIGCWRLYGYDL